MFLAMTKVLLLLSPMALMMLSSNSGATKSFAEFFSENSSLDESESFLPIYSIAPNKRRMRGSKLLGRWGWKSFGNSVNEEGLTHER